MCGAKPCDSPNCTWGERHRAACEARTVMHWPKEQRERYYREVLARRGQAAMKKLIEDVRMEWKNRQSLL